MEADFTIQICYANQTSYNDEFNGDTIFLQHFEYILVLLIWLLGFYLYVIIVLIRTIFTERTFLNNNEHCESAETVIKEERTAEIVEPSRKLSLKNYSCPNLKLKFCSQKDVDAFDACDLREIIDKENKTCYEQEEANEYCHGGYMSVSLGDVLVDKFEVVRKLGFGHFSTVWLCHNNETSDYAALKISKSARMFRAVASDEIKLLECTRTTKSSHPGYKHIVQMFESFNCESVNGTHSAIAMEIMGPSLLHLIICSDYQGLQIPAVKKILKQVLLGLTYIHEECKIIHTDIKPENILIKIKYSHILQMVTTVRKIQDLGMKMPKSFVAASNLASEDYCESSDYESEDVENFEEQPRKRTQSFPFHFNSACEWSNYCSEIPKRDKTPRLQAPMWVDPNIEVKIADLGNACWEDHHFCKQIQTKQYRSLEVIMGAEYSYPADLWSLGCVAFELATGEFLFNPKSYGSCSDTLDHLTLIWEVLDGIPEYITKIGEKAHNYFKKGKLKDVYEEDLKIWILEDVLVDKYLWKREDAVPFANFIKTLIEPDPNRRSTAAMALQNKWLNQE